MIFLTPASLACELGTSGNTTPNETLTRLLRDRWNTFRCASVDRSELEIEIKTDADDILSYATQHACAEGGHILHCFKCQCLCLCLSTNLGGIAPHLAELDRFWANNVQFRQDVGRTLTTCGQLVAEMWGSRAWKGHLEWGYDCVLLRETHPYTQRPRLASQLTRPPLHVLRARTKVSRFRQPWGIAPPRARQRCRSTAPRTERRRRSPSARPPKRLGSARRASVRQGGRP